MEDALVKSKRVGWSCFANNMVYDLYNEKKIGRLYNCMKTNYSILV